ncbi:hypothetical protein L841_1393 [Mycobacterium sp. MAC_080597_8934]|nr:hypothetical protein L841_1393 [Mycobacterium sp. MAC_080597_8934]ETZ85810.1 hypothetical protein L840_0086 [Mycobacterium sp. MAC_011194_8550]
MGTFSWPWTWSTDANSRGYYLAAFEDAWSRYVKEPEAETQAQAPAANNGHHIDDESILKSTKVEF